MTSRRTTTLAAALVAGLVVTGCGSSTSSGGSPSTSSSGANSSNGSADAGAKTVKIGVLTDVTGPAASGNKTTVEGVKAGAVYAARMGYRIHYVVGDTATSPASTLSAAQKLVVQDHVSAVIAVLLSRSPRPAI